LAVPKGTAFFAYGVVRRLSNYQCFYQDIKSLKILKMGQKEPSLLTQLTGEGDGAILFVEILFWKEKIYEVH